MASWLIPVASAHVEYVLDKTREVTYGPDWSFFLEPFNHASNVLLAVGAAALILILYFAASGNKKFQDRVEQSEKHTNSYRNIAPWILRLALGIGLIGAASNGNLISPLLPHMPTLALAQTVVGFLLLAGFLTGPAILAAIILYAFALSESFYVLGNIEFLGAALALLLWGSAKPGVDDLLGIRFTPRMKDRAKDWGLTVARMGLGVSFIFLAIYEKFWNPHVAAAVVSQYNLTSIVPVSPEMWVVSSGIIELLIGVAILIGFKTRLAAVVSFLVVCATFFFFQEIASAHVVIFAILSLLIALGGGKLSVDRDVKFQRR